mmetsp:Transcript_69386/g.201304  ORF Transcript_69386/g.201304 Transcript_69386/m.201304 type:complete len:204 (-) Transcript_69386:533-1144(-)
MASQLQQLGGHRQAGGTEVLPRLGEAETAVFRRRQLERLRAEKNDLGPRPVVLDLRGPDGRERLRMLPDLVGARQEEERTPRHSQRGQLCPVGARGAGRQGRGQALVRRGWSGGRAHGVALVLVGGRESSGRGVVILAGREEEHGKERCHVRGDKEVPQEARLEGLQAPGGWLLLQQVPEGLPERHRLLQLPPLRLRRVRVLR